MMTLPANYTVICEEEMTYLEGGSYADLFNYLIGNYLRDQVLSGVRTAVWNSAKQGSVTPLVSWYQSLEDMSMWGHLGFFIGCALLCQTVKTYLEK